MNEFEKQSLILALKKLFKDNHFSICTIDNCLKITNVKPNPQDYACLSVLHCVAWGDMPQDFRDEVFKKIINMFQEVVFDLSLVDEIMNQKTIKITKEQSIWKRLISA